MCAAKNILIDRYFSELLNKGDFAKAHEILAPDFVFYSPSTTGGLSSEGFHRYIKEMKAAFSNKHFIELDRIAEGDRVASRFRMIGTQDGSYLGLPPLGVQIDVEGCDLISIRSGKIVEVRAYFDLMAIIQKFLVPPPIRTIGEFMGHLWPR